jgi:hypothetical protein
MTAQYPHSGTLIRTATGSRMNTGSNMLATTVAWLLKGAPADVDRRGGRGSNAAMLARRGLRLARSVTPIGSRGCR